ncbi:MAG TPA: GIY-YIG nuclease family protein [Candidatus Dormibacteraeota bacterium]|nr:GIY-YIG nuclease family protein [Candidatus Dormibacteraeota bacterium]
MGPLQFPPGVYLYVGSALNTLEGRISRHLRKTKRKHWHIDYLLSTRGVRILRIGRRPTTRDLECSISKAIEKLAFASVSGFGCSDCICESHLYRIDSLSRALRTLVELVELKFHFS